MGDQLWPDHLTAILTLGVGGPAIGLLGLLERGGRVSAAAVLAGVLGVAAAAAAALGQPAVVWAMLAGLAAADLLPRLARRCAARLAPSVEWALRSRRLHAAAMLGATPLLGFGWSYQFNRANEAPDLEESFPVGAPSTWRMVPAGVGAATNQGRPVPLYVGAADQTPEENFPQGLAVRLIRTSGPDLRSNCHGWVFTGGRYCVLSEAVNRILADNGYEQVSQPQPGDLIVFGRPGAPEHTGLVRVVDDGLVLVESKWGVLGNYLHRPEDQPYSQDWTFYRGARSSHLLAGDWRDAPADAGVNGGM